MGFLASLQRPAVCLPHIEVSFDIDANGILNVTAQDKTTGKFSNTMITNDKGRLSKDQIDRMANDAEKSRDNDEKSRARIQAKNQLESYAYSVRNTIKDEKVADKISAEDKAKIEDAVKAAIEWLNHNQTAEGRVRRQGEGAGRYCAANHGADIPAGSGCWLYWLYWNQN